MPKINAGGPVLIPDCNMVFNSPKSIIRLVKKQQRFKYIYGGAPVNSICCRGTRKKMSDLPPGWEEKTSSSTGKTTKII